VHNLTFGPKLLTWLRPHTSLPFVVHLEIEKPDEFVDTFAEAGSDLIVVHRDVCDDPVATIDRIRAHGVKAGVALNPDSPVSEVVDVFDQVDLLLIMSVHPGFGGQSLMPATLDKLRTARRRAQSLGLAPLIGLDGGINLETIQDCIAAGANFLAIGTAIYGDGRAAENAKALRGTIGHPGDDVELDRTARHRWSPSTVGQLDQL
jgi:ribulose-phosphate 3-epimerase